MNEYISREAVLAHKWEVRVCDPNDPDPVSEVVSVSSILRIPTADVVEVRHGRWEQVEIFHVEDLKEEDKDCISIASMFCPKCKRYHNEVYIYGSPTESVRYCSNCGSKMDGGQDDG